MKSLLPFVFCLAVFFVTLSTTSLRADDWKTTDGKVYQNVTVLHCDPDAVTILHKDGGALVPLELLPDDLQKRFHYDPKAAKAAADARMQQEIADAHALRAERDQVTNRRKEENAETARCADSAPALSSDSAAATASSGSHYSMDDLIGSTQPMRRDLSDPTYHTMAHLVRTTHSLRADPNDPNHYSINDATNPSP